MNSFPITTLIIALEAMRMNSDAIEISGLELVSIIFSVTAIILNVALIIYYISRK